MIVLIITTEDCPRLVNALLEARFEVITETSSPDAMRRLMEEDPQVIIVREDMPSPVPGLEFLPVLRRFSEAPIVVIGSGGNQAMVEALLKGADEYFSRPVNLRVLLARIRAMLRRYTEGGQPPPNRPPDY